MNKKLIYLIVSFLIVIVVISTFIKFTYGEEKTDSIIFKQEYESYNKDLISLKIRKNNNIKYSSYDEIIDIIQNGTGVIYLGTPTSNWCRNIINPLFDATNNNDIETIYYLDISKDMDYYIVEDDKLVYRIDDNGKEQKGTEEYFKLVDLLKDYLSPYTIELDDKKYTTDSYRIYLPTVIFVKDGEIVGFHVSTVISHINEDKKLTDDEYEELYDIYEGYILDMSSDTCSIDKNGSGC